MFGLDNFDIHNSLPKFGTEGKEGTKGVRDIRDSLLWLDIQDIITKAKDNAVSFNYEATIHTETANIAVLKIQTIATQRDYVENIGDNKELEIMVPMGMYRDYIYPFRNNLEISIKKTILASLGGGKKQDSQIVIERYKAVFSSSNPPPNNSDTDQIDTFSLDLAGIHSGIKFQLLDKSLEPLRIKTVGGVFKNVSSEDVIRTVLVGESNNVLLEGNPCIDGLDLVKPNNEVVRQHIVIPDGTEIFKVPTYIQEKVGGIYSNGIGTYLQTYEGKKLWFVYPLTDVTRFEEMGGKKLTVYGIPAKTLAGIDRTYYVDGDNVSVLAVGNAIYSDDANAGYMNKGSGFRMAEAGAFMNKPVELDENNNPLGARGRLNYEMIASERADGLNYAPIAKTRISCNPFNEYTKVNINGVSDIITEWDRSDPDLIHPGMPCQYVFLYNDEIVKLKGTVLGVITTYYLAGKSMADNTYISKTKLRLSCERFLPPDAATQI